MKILFSIFFFCAATLAFAQDVTKNKKNTNPPGTNAIVPISPNPPELKPICFLDGKRIEDPAPGTVDVNNIASIEIITDSTAVALYGESARDGVILIHTVSKPFPGKQAEIRSRGKEEEIKN